MGFGRQTLYSAGTSVEVSADGQPEAKIGGVTIDWSTVSAVSGSDVTLNDGVTVKVGEKYLRYGQVISLIGVAEVQTITYTGGPTAGSATITIPASGAYAAETAAAVAFNASAAAMQSALTALSRVGPNGATVARTGAGSAGDPYVYTVTFAPQLGNVPQMTSTHTFTGGTTPTTTHGTTTSGTDAGGKYGPYDPAASDGRQTAPANGYAFILNRTALGNEPVDEYPEAIYGGRVFLDRIIQSGAATHTLALGPTLAELKAAFPRLQLVTGA